MRTVSWVAEILLNLQVDEGVRVFSGVPFIRALILFMSTPSSSSNYLPKALSPNTVKLGARTSTYEFWGNKHIQSIGYPNHLRTTDVKTEVGVVTCMSKATQTVSSNVSTPKSGLSPELTLFTLSVSNFCSVRK